MNRDDMYINRIAAIDRKLDNLRKKKPYPLFDILKLMKHRDNLVDKW